MYIDTKKQPPNTCRIGWLYGIKLQFSLAFQPM